MCAKWAYRHEIYQANTSEQATLANTKILINSRLFNPSNEHQDSQHN